MFKVQFFVDDKNLGEVFKRLTGVARNLEHAYVPNVESKPNGKLHVTGADGAEAFVNEMRKRKITEVTAKSAREICVSIGFLPTSYSYVLAGVLRAGFLKRVGTPQKYRYLLKSEK